MQDWKMTDHMAIVLEMLYPFVHVRCILIDKLFSHASCMVSEIKFSAYVSTEFYSMAG